MPDAVELLADREIFPHAPVRVTLQFELETEDEYLAHVDWSFPAGVIPTSDEIASIAARVKEEAEAATGKALRWPSRKEFGRNELLNRSGVRMSFTNDDAPFECDWANN